MEEVEAAKETLDFPQGWDKDAVVQCQTGYSELQDLELPQQGGRPVENDSNPALYDLGVSWE